MRRPNIIFLCTHFIIKHKRIKTAAKQSDNIIIGQHQCYVIERFCNIIWMQQCFLNVTASKTLLLFYIADIFCEGSGAGLLYSCSGVGPQKTHVSAEQKDQNVTYKLSTEPSLDWTDVRQRMYPLTTNVYVSTVKTRITSLSVV